LEFIKSIDSITVEADILFQILPVFVISELFIDVPSNGFNLCEGFAEISLVVVALWGVLDHILQQELVPESKLDFLYISVQLVYLIYETASKKQILVFIFNSSCSMCT